VLGLLTAGCVVGYRDLPDLPDRWGTPWTRTTGQYEQVGRYRTLERCRQDPKVDRCEEEFEFSLGGGGLSGVSGSVTWQVIEVKAGGDAHSSWSSFVLVLRETNGSAITFTRVDQYLNRIWQGADRTVRSLQANGELRLPFASRRLCVGTTCPAASPPTWDIAFTGKDERDQEVRVAMKIVALRSPLTDVVSRSGAAAAKQTASSHFLTHL